MAERREPIEVDYRIRPGKQAERKLLAELIGRLDRLRPITDYRYVGMGSIYFVDFVMMHRLFGIERMISIEQREEIIERCRFNNPYDCVEILESSVGSALPTLRSDQPTVMWLDYTGPTNEGRLEEIAVACADLAPGSFFIVTTDVSVPIEAERMQWFEKHFGDRDSAQIDEPADINRRKFPARMWSYIDGAIRDGVSARPDDALYEQLVHIRYKDGAEMLTAGGVIYNQGTDLSECEYDSLDFVARGSEPYELRVPRLTYRERITLDQLLPTGNLADAPDGLEDEDVEAYARLYRYAPFYVDIHV